ncbi:MAG: T9SS type A sorting domain-containing protein, partial [Bacteroidia bacterium]|nr:T9SS type A sorting domain-containing protein [Bacteroidia bacterium]
TPTANTSYSISATSSNGCTNTAIATVSINTPPVITVSGGLICGGAPYTLTPSGASTYTYSGGSAIVSPTANASYSITGTSAHGCVSSNTAVVNLTVSAAPIISVGNGTICSGTSFTLSPSGASTYTYSGGSAVVSPSNTSFYTVSGTNSLGCTSNSPAIAIISVVNAPVVTAASGSICQGSSFQLQAFGATSYTYQGGSSVVTPTANSSYTIIGSSGNGCTSATPAVVNVTVNAIPVISVNSGSVCQGNSFTLTPSGASTYIYSSGSPVVSPFNTTTVSVSGTSSAGCVSQIAAISTITVSSLPFVTVNGGAICSGNSFTLLPSGAVSYTYSSGSAIVSPTANASYSITGSTSQGCVSSNTAVANLVVNTTPTVTAASGTICEGSIFAITAGGANSYTYSGGSSVVSPTTNSTYTVTGSSNGCVSQVPAIVTVTVFARPVISVNSGSVCSGNSFTLLPSGASSYNYSSGSAVVTPFNTSTYSVSGTSSVGCVSQSAAVANVSVISLPFISVNNGAICSGQSFTMLPSGAITYTYSSGSAVVTPTANTSYSVTGSNAAGCVSSNTAVANVSVGSSPTITAANGTICAGASFVLNPSGGTTYTYSSGSAIVTPSANASYTIDGANAIGCISSSPAVVLITVNPTPTISVNNGVVCSGVPFTITPTGATSYTYSSGSPVVSPTVTSYYLVSGTNSFGCVSSNPAAALVTVNSAPVITAANGLICGGGSFLIQPTGAATYSYSSGSPTVSPTANTSYTVSGTSLAGCVSQSPAIVTVSVEALPVITVNSGSVCAGVNFTITPSGAATYSYSSGSPVVTPFVNASYSVTGTSSAGCTSSVVVSQVTVVSLPIVNVNSGAICEGKSFTMVPTGALNYTFSGGSAIVSPTTTSTYSVTGSDASGCLSANTAISNVTVTPGPTVTASSSNTLICAGETVTLSASGAVQYVWNGTTISTTLMVSPVLPTVYSVKGTDSEGCSGTFTLNQNVSDCTSLSGVEKEQAFNLYPNPNSGEFTIVSKGDITLTLINELGQHIQTISLDENNEHKIQLREIAYGIYFVVGVNNNQFIKQKVVISK